MKRAFKLRSKAFFIIFKRLSIKQIAQIFLEGEGPTLSNPYYNRACNLAPLEKFPFYYSCRLRACIFTESKLFYNTRGSAARRCSGKFLNLEILQNSRVNNYVYSLEL